MARIRTIKPEFWQDEDIAMLKPEGRLLAIGILNMADDEGYFKAHPALVKAAVFPFSEPSVSAQEMLNQLSEIGYLTLYRGTDGKQYGWIRNFCSHQKVNRPTPSKIKELIDFTEDSVIDHGLLTAGKEQGTGKGTGKGTGNREQGKEQGVRDSAPPSSPSPRKKSTESKPSCVEDVQAYMAERSFPDPQSEADHFFDHYQANGWVQSNGRPIKDWKAAVRNWQRRSVEFGRNKPRPAGKQAVIPVQGQSGNQGSGVSEAQLAEIRKHAGIGQ